MGCRASFAMALTMSSRSFVAAKMHVKVSTVSCTTLWENTATFGFRSRGDAPYVESQCSSASCRTADARGDSTDAVLGRGCLHARCVQTVMGSRRAENCGFSQLQSRQGV